MHEDITMVEAETSVQVKQGLESFVFMEQTNKALGVAMATEQNVVLYGKGGYGKSEYAIEYFRSLGIEPYVITMGTGMTTERLFGGFDIKTFNETGKMEYLVENSFMNNEYVIFEELFDAPDFILEQLKDIISAGVFRNGTQQFQIKTQLIICCTNKTREEFAKNTSLKALMERFPLEHCVKWENHDRASYQKLFETKLGSYDPFLTYALESYHISGNTISPRIALAAAEVLATCGIECLEFLADFATQKDLLKNTIAKYQSVIKFDKLHAEIAPALNEINKITTFDPRKQGVSELQKYSRLVQDAGRMLREIENLSVDDSQVSAKASVVTVLWSC